MTSTHNSENGRRFTGRHMLFLVCGFFAVIIAVNAVMAMFATSTFPGLVVKNSFVASQDFNRELARQTAQVASGRRGQLGYRNDELVFQLTGAGGKGLDGLSVQATLGRPTDASSDRTLSLTGTGDGRYAAGTVLPSGQWQVRLIARDRDELAFRRTYRLVVKERP